MEDAPCLQRRLLIHFVLDLPVDIPCTLLNVKGIPLSATFGAHNHFTSLILVAFQLSRIILESKMPKLLLFDTLRILLEDFKEVLTLLDLPFGIGMDDLSKILHESEITSHSVCQSSDLA